MRFPTAGSINLKSGPQTGQQFWPEYPLNFLQYLMNIIFVLVTQPPPVFKKDDRSILMRKYYKTP